MCFRLEGSPVLFSGDTLFPGGPGNTSFANASFDQIIRSIEDRLYAPLGRETIVMPGHGKDTTLGQEIPHLQEWIDRRW
jgi:glyoxylase-like metal-dependent hydrolase (beta-lactamase superfamily II)